MMESNISHDHHSLTEVQTFKLEMITSEQKSPDAHRLKKEENNKLLVMDR